MVNCVKRFFFYIYIIYRTWSSYILFEQWEMLDLFLHSPLELLPFGVWKFWVEVSFIMSLHSPFVAASSFCTLLAPPSLKASQKQRYIYWCLQSYVDLLWSALYAEGEALPDQLVLQV